MRELTETIERVVREVLASLGHTAAGPRANGESVATSPPPVQTPAQPVASQEPSDALVLDRRVVTLADLPDRTNGVRRVIVPRAAVVTPAVKDELQRRRIQLVVGEPTNAVSKKANVILMVAATPFDSAPLATALERDGLAVQSHRMDCLIRATDQLAEDLKSGSTVGILATAHAAPAMCLANRHAAVRAVLGVRADTVAADADSVGANLLVIDPTATGFFALKQMASRFLRGGPRPCPKVFQKRLNGVS